jgi:urease accessory protein
LCLKLGIQSFLRQKLPRCPNGKSRPVAVAKFPTQALMKIPSAPILSTPASGQPTGGWHGEVTLSFSPDPKGKTLAQLHLASAPFKVQRSFYPESGSPVKSAQRCYTTLLHTAGGMVAGDHLSIHLHLKPQAQALVTTSSASKIYGQVPLKSPIPVQATQNILIKVEAEASLEWLPQETIVFDGADYAQQLRIELAATASCLGWEVTRFGRTARGERFLSGRWQAHTEVWREGRPLWVDPQWLLGGSELLDSEHGLAGQPLIGTLFWIGNADGVDSKALVTAARERWLSQPRQGEAGVTWLDAGLICRYRGANRQELHAWFVQVWQLVRHCQGLPAASLPRVWPV